jgi:hypothetical protein
MYIIFIIIFKQFTDLKGYSIFIILGKDFSVTLYVYSICICLYLYIIYTYSVLLYTLYIPRCITSYTSH